MSLIVCQMMCCNSCESYLKFLIKFSNFNSVQILLISIAEGIVMSIQGSNHPLIWIFLMDRLGVSGGEM